MKRKIEILVHYTDLHIPREDKECTQLLLDFLKDVQPDYIVETGDRLNNQSVSKHKKNPMTTPTLIEELQAGKAFTEKVEEICPKSKKLITYGNHDLWIQNYVWEHPELSQLIDVDKELGFKEHNWKTFGYGDVYAHHDIFLFTHGKIARQHSGWTAKAMVDKTGANGAHGHTHRAGSSYRNDYSGARGWWEGGCMCDFELSKEWFNDPYPNWQHAVNVIYFWKGRYKEWDFHLDQIIIPEEDRFIFYQGDIYELKGEKK